METREQREEVKKAVAMFPAEFGMTHSPGRRFRISPTASYYSEHAAGVLVYTQIFLDGEWLDYAKGTVMELREVLVKLPKGES